jgi:enoyl-CoA hydratase
MSDYTCILYRTGADRVARITLNRPEKRNALNLTLRGEFVNALKRAERDDSVSVVLVDGAGSSFCAGYDMGSTVTPAPEGGYISEKYYDDWSDQFARGCVRDWLTIWDLMKPVVAKVHGNCLAGGTELMSLCDVAFVTDDARLGYPPMRAQSTPDTVYFPWKMSMAHAKYLQLTGNVINGKTAADWGWVAKSFPKDKLDAEVEKEVKAMATIPPDLLGLNKQALNQAYDMQGFKTALLAATPWHKLSAKYRPTAGEFRRVQAEQGLKAAIQWRDSAFRDVDV